MELETLRTWFLQNKRSFPWRENPSPYGVWISEVMLQQTQASRVIAYYRRWMQKYPDIETLAASSYDEVMKLWEGLGYYSRAKALHAAAQDIVERFQGKIPDTKEALSSIKGLGPYTVGAILAFGFHQKEAAVDANVIRVLARLFALQEDVCKPKTVSFLRDKAASMLPEERPWEVTEALIELGATVCQKRPNCTKCPLSKFCQGYIKNIQEMLPIKSLKVQYEALFREVAVIFSENDKVLVGQGKKGMPCAGLYEFAYFDAPSSGLAADILEKMITEKLGLTADFEEYLQEEKQSFTRYRVTLYPKRFTTKEKMVPGYHWCSLKEAEMLTFSSGHKRILKDLILNIEGKR